ncbi:unnamed protein product, partial [Staurois parvus]
MSLFVIFKSPAIPSPVRPDTRRGRNPDDRCRHLPEDLSGDTAGGDKVREEQIPDQRHMVSPSVAPGYRFCYTLEYRQGG